MSCDSPECKVCNKTKAKEVSISPDLLDFACRYLGAEPNEAQIELMKDIQEKLNRFKKFRWPRVFEGVTNVGWNSSTPEDWRAFCDHTFLPNKKLRVTVEEIE